MSDSFQFKYVYKGQDDQDDTLFTASRNGDMWDVLWWNQNQMKIDYVEYADKAVQENLRNGTWRVERDESEYKEPLLPQHFEFSHKDFPDDVYTASRDGEYYNVQWDNTNGQGTSAYPDSWVEGYVKEGLWIIKNVDDGFISADDLVKLLDKEYDFPAPLEGRELLSQYGEAFPSTYQSTETDDEYVRLSYLKVLAKDVGGAITIDQDYLTLHADGGVYETLNAQHLIAVVAAVKLLQETRVN